MYHKMSKSDNKCIGIISENHIITLLEKLSGMDCLHHINGSYDLTWNSLPIEVKSAQICRTGSAPSHSPRRNYHGFSTYKRQLSSLIRKNGYFAFVLMLGREPLVVRFIKAPDTKPYLISYGKKLRISLSILYSGLSPDQFVEEHLLDRYLT